MNKKSIKSRVIYAISEILLIVVGIFIAIQLNNWNDDRKNKKLAVEYLVGIKKDLSVDTMVFEQVISLTNGELPLLAERINTTNYNELSLKNLKKFVINSFGLDIDAIDKSYRKVVNLGITSITNNKKLENNLDMYYNFLNSRLETFIRYDGDQTQQENAFWFYNQNKAEMFLSVDDSFPFVGDTIKRKLGLAELFESVKARNYMRSEYYRSEQLLLYIEEMNVMAKRLIVEIDNELKQ